MPVYNSMISSWGNNVIDQAQFAQLPFYLVKNELNAFKDAQIYDKFFSAIPWIENSGSTMKAVTPQRSPVNRSFIFPNSIQTIALKDVYTVTESQETAQVFAHKFESFQFNYLPNFQAFWDTYLQFQNRDLADKIALANNQFIETNMWYNAINCYLCGTGMVGGLPRGMGNVTYNAAGTKTAAFLINLVQGSAGQPGVLQDLRLRDVYRAVMALQEDLRAPSFSGMRNVAKDNEGVKGKYILVTSAEAWLNFTWDPDTLNKSNGLPPFSLDLLFEDFKGMLFGTVTTKITPYPVRFSTVNISDTAGNVLWAAGTPIDPEIFDPIDQKWKPNLYYTSLLSAPYEINWLLGDGYARTIKVGPPPKEFANQSISAQKFYKMQWNGEIRLTDQVFIYDANGNIVDFNSYGEQLKFQSKLTFGYLPGEVRNAFPIIRRRTRPAFSNQ